MSAAERPTRSYWRSGVFLVASIGLLPTILNATMAITSKYYWSRYHGGWTYDNDLIALSWIAGVALLFEILLVFLVFAANEPRRAALRALVVGGVLLAVWQFLDGRETIGLLWTFAGGGILLALLASDRGPFGRGSMSSRDQA